MSQEREQSKRENRPRDRFCKRAADVDRCDVEGQVNVRCRGEECAAFAQESARQRIHRQSAAYPRKCVDEFNRIEITKSDQMENFGDEVRQCAIGAEQVKRATDSGRPVEELRGVLVETDEIVIGEQAGVGLKCAGVSQRSNGKDREERHEHWVET
jgi:hypothetical protein